MFTTVAIAVLVLLVLMTALSKATQIRKSLLPFVGKTVHVRVWGAPLGDATFKIDSISSFGAGLHIFLRPPGEGRAFLKVAQPKSVSISQETIEIPYARYVQWHGRKLEQKADSAAVTLLVRS